jgi:hypothetical protein
MKGSMRTRLQESMAQLDSKYRAALKDDAMQAAFESLWEAWSREMGAMIHSEVLSTLDLLLLTAALDNRRQLEELRRRLEELNREDC